MNVVILPRPSTLRERVRKRKMKRARLIDRDCHFSVSWKISDMEEECGLPSYYNRLRGRLNIYRQTRCSFVTRKETFLLLHRSAVGCKLRNNVDRLLSRIEYRRTRA